MNILFFLKPKSEVAYLYEDYSLRQALEKMEHYRYSAVPIINRNGGYVGTITEGDVLWGLKDLHLEDIYETEMIPLKEIKRRWDNEPVNVQCNIEDLVLTSLNQNFVPVVDDNQIFIGIVTRQQIMKHFYRTYQEEQESGVI